MSTVWLNILSSFPPIIIPSTPLYSCYPPSHLLMSRELRSARTVATSTTPTAPAAPRASRGRKRLQSNAEETVPKRSKTDTAQDDNNDSDDDKLKEAPVKGKGKGKGPARGRTIRCVALPSLSLHLLTTPPTIS
jgi:hypothetical protein